MPDEATEANSLAYQEWDADEDRTRLRDIPWLLCILALILNLFERIGRGVGKRHPSATKAD